ncbi:CGNR zinc finger domain-containing protein [Undibacterium sp. TJN25]|uniref:CGNR zinc finger domain-containing protein n=1 Tax=Undibacterium sp. TJN25 TaxID=3413056 RepID=UPI003BF1F2ED
MNLLEPPIIADHPALDLLNTAALIDGKLYDFLQTDAAVLSWLERTGFLKGRQVPQYEVNALRDTAHSLRDIAGVVVAQFKAGIMPNMVALNCFLACGRRHVQVVRCGKGLGVEERYDVLTPKQLLTPVAQSVAELLAKSAPSALCKCENPECSLLFQDKTKSRRRRWCSMAICGNRHKAANYRRRRQSKE